MRLPWAETNDDYPRENGSCQALQVKRILDHAA